MKCRGCIYWEGSKDIKVYKHGIYMYAGVCGLDNCLKVEDDHCDNYEPIGCSSCDEPNHDCNCYD